MSNSSNGLLTAKNASNFKLHARTRRHKQYVTSEIEISCFRPTGLNLDPDANCHFVRHNYHCNFDTKLINYLEFAVCTIRIDDFSWFGEVGYIVCSLVVLLFLIFSVFVMTRWFILPNVLTLFNWTTIRAYHCGILIVSTLFILPNLFKSSIICNSPKELYSLFLTESGSRAFSMYGLGLALISINKTLHAPPFHCIVSLLVIVLGNIYVYILLSYKTKNDTLPKGEQGDLKLEGHAKFLIIVYLVYLFAQLYDPFKSMLFRSNTIVEVIRTPEQIESENVIEDVLEGVVTTTSTEHTETTNSPFKVNFRKFYGDIFGRKYIIFNILCAPLWIILTLLIPVINENLHFHGWNKYLLSTNLIFISLPLMGYIKIEICFALVAIGFLAAGVILYKTSATEPPRFYKVFSVFGLFTAFMIWHLLTMEADTLIHQSLQYVIHWDLDAVVVASSSFSSSVTEMIFIYELIKYEEMDIAFGLVTGLAVYNTIGSFPATVLQPCFDTSSFLFITSNNCTIYVFMFLMIGYTFTALCISNFQLRRTFGMFLVIFCSLFILYIILTAYEVVHSYGSQHSPTVLYNSFTHSNWS
ncbi:uncharacterized protein LOC105214933 [Zeugodacus cucurbitae]|uniref:uncharacterized protein LOC105214933 n=1 Tax=Zeugodacus cucurbitae TaxID=28588 RepID=UPI0010A744C4|nr:uncharacterized protein LOC105214933 [Zeugodacus cucurbitae]